MVATNPGSCALIGFLEDNDEKGPWPTKTYKVTRAGIAHGGSVKFLLAKTFDRKRLVRDRYPNSLDKTNTNYKEVCMLMPTD